MRTKSFVKRWFGARRILEVWFQRNRRSRMALDPFDESARYTTDPRVFRVDDCGSLVFDEINRTIVTQKSLLQLFFWQVLFLDIGKI